MDCPNEIFIISDSNEKLLLLLRMTFQALVDKEEKAWGVGTLVIVFVGLWGLYRYFRFVYPCLTPFELDEALKTLDGVYFHAEEAHLRVEIGEWDSISTNHYSLQQEASHIRMQVAEGCGFNPRMVPKIARWYKRSKALERQILIVRERDLQKRLEAEGQIYGKSPFGSPP
ncbi:hypothetical protein L218DRAFT_948459 [Marasmius fiardii PR-910]|nr:hypothetical protein L218DRAFT_948459 [Marasmius fiardii PR-910]